MLKKNNINLKGFTIIEVVLVLAIAALIIAGVFVALPNLQNAQKDTVQKQDVATMGTKIVESYGNNGKAFFAPGASDACKYGGQASAVKRTDGTSGNLSCSKHYSGAVTDKTATNYPDVSVTNGAKCAGTTTTAFSTTAQTGSFALATKLTSGSIYCVTLTAE